VLTVKLISAFLDPPSRTLCKACFSSFSFKISSDVTVASTHGSYRLVFFTKFCTYGIVTCDPSYGGSAARVVDTDPAGSEIICILDPKLMPKPDPVPGKKNFRIRNCKRFSTFFVTSNVHYFVPVIFGPFL
jgi:hypothetical protein